MSKEIQDLERRIIGTMLMNKGAAEIVMSIVSGEQDFYYEKHKIIFKGCQRLFNEGIPIDIHTLSDEIKNENELESVGGYVGLSDMMGNVTALKNLEFHVRILCQSGIRRQIEKFSYDVMREVKDESNDPIQMLDECSDELYKIQSGYFRKKANNGEQLSVKLRQQVDELMQIEGYPGIASGLKAVDERLKGFRDTDLIILAGRPGMGKTAFMLTLAYNMIRVGRKASVFSLEMSDLQLGYRLAALDSGIPVSNIRNGDLNESQYQRFKESIDSIHDFNIDIDDTGALSVQEFRIKARESVKNGAEIIFIDYLQLMTWDGKTSNNNEKFTNISKLLKAVAKENEVPVIALSQLSRAPEKRGGLSKPKLSDLRESGAIEQDADIVLFPFRPSYYDVNSDESDCLIVEKFRNGQVGTVELKFVGSEIRWRDRNKSDIMTISSNDFESMNYTDSPYGEVDESDDTPF